MGKHKHHIIPVYHCKELGIDPDFDENIVEVDRLDHARIHWGYKCDDLEPLFEYITPAQWIIDLIPRGDNRDVGAAAINARGEIDGIDQSGENHWNWGKKASLETREKISKNSARAFLGKTHTPEVRERISKAQSGDTNSSHKHGMYINIKNDINVRRVVTKMREENDPSIVLKNRERAAAYREKNRDEINRKAREHRLINKEEMNRKQRERRAKKKAEGSTTTQGEGTLKAFLK